MTSINKFQHFIFIFTSLIDRALCVMSLINCLMTYLFLCCTLAWSAAGHEFNSRMGHAKDFNIATWYFLAEALKGYTKETW